MAATTSSAPEDAPTQANAQFAAPPATVNGGTDGFDASQLPIESLQHRINEIVSNVDELERKVDKIAKFYANDSKDKKLVLKSSRNQALKDKDGEERMRDLMRQFGTIVRQISQHKWADPFKEPVDVVSYGLHDYYDIIKKPMDFSTIKNQMEAKDGSGYKNVREIYADVRLIFTNAMTYNDEKDDVHVMAKSLLAKFEEKWLQLLPKVLAEERRQQEVEAQALENMQTAQEAAIVKMARATNNRLAELNLNLDELREAVAHKCRMSAEDKRKLCTALSYLSDEDLVKVLGIIAESNPGFQAMSEEVDINLDEQSEATLWKLKFFLKNSMNLQAKNPPSNVDRNRNAKRKKEICQALAKIPKRKSKLLSSM
ncbi:Bromodomain-containing protein [Dioscorea alata]|uniref:Bromodomain-containing protein n=1 Tax=Dioscorea alata TaxID=55571 RepID=A0ACB7V238_DIOAL|nr:Bromodomain-containing protein [Dioscorea alata]